nr:MAG TPA: hypothetical protein [Caudoviricetes sp.]
MLTPNRDTVQLLIIQSSNVSRFTSFMKPFSYVSDTL